MSDISRGAEEFVSSWLEERGWDILYRNFRTCRGEIDIIAQNSDTVTFVEVKFARDGSATMPLVKIDRRKQSRISSSAEVFLSRIQPPDQVRFDVAVVGGNPGKYRMSTYIEDAFRPDLP